MTRNVFAAVGARVLSLVLPLGDGVSLALKR